MGMVTDRILIISDPHYPYSHPGILDFLSAVRLEYKPTVVICTGDEIDGHAWSFHTTDPDAMSAGFELRAARQGLKQLERLFPEMTLLESNHGSLIYRRAFEAGLPRDVIHSYREITGVGEGWTWSRDITLQLPDGSEVYGHHGKKSNVTLLAQAEGKHAFQGHFHSRFKVEHWAHSTGTRWAMQVGCLVDADSRAFAYAHNDAQRFVIGCGMIIDSQPMLIRLKESKSGGWSGRL